MRGKKRSAFQHIGHDGTIAWKKKETFLPPAGQVGSSQVHHVAASKTAVGQVTTQRGFRIGWRFHFVVLSGNNTASIVRRGWCPVRQSFDRQMNLEHPNERKMTTEHPFQI
jgi:hypothetical protein